MSLFRNQRYIQQAVLVLLGACFLWLLLLTLLNSRPAESADHQPGNAFEQIDACVKGSPETYRVTRVGSQAMSPAQIGCVNYIRAQYALMDFNIRKREFYQQQYRGEVLLWMVVCITISGVVLAGLQLYAAYQLSIRGQQLRTKIASVTGDGPRRVPDMEMPLATEAKLSIEHGKVSLTSSVTGLLILALSLAFFIFYLKWVYPISQVRIDGDQSAVSTAGTYLQGVGQLLTGKPPANATGASPPMAAAISTQALSQPSTEVARTGTVSKASQR